MCVSHSVLVEIRGQTERVGSLLLCWSQGSNSGLRLDSKPLYPPSRLPGKKASLNLSLNCTDMYWAHTIYELWRKFWILLLLLLRKINYKGRQLPIPLAFMPVYYRCSGPCWQISVKLKIMAQSSSSTWDDFTPSFKRSFLWWTPGSVKSPLSQPYYICLSMPSAVLALAQGCAVSSVCGRGEQVNERSANWLLLTLATLHCCNLTSASSHSSSSSNQPTGSSSPRSSDEQPILWIRV